jgi:proteasome lid subunit RPN8/RPN11
MDSSTAPGARGRHAPAALVLDEALLAEMTAHCLRAYPAEGCGLLAGESSSGRAVRCFPTRNQAASARLYVVDPGDHLRADREAESEGLEIIGVFHSHTHTDAYPSATDIAQAPDPDWHYVLVSLRGEAPSVRSFHISGAAVVEEPIAIG